MKSLNQNRFESIDALRGLAAMLVIWQHTSETFIRKTGVAEHGTFLADIARDYDFGRIGIICFFLISGFVIPSSLKDTNQSGVEHFVIRRFFRLYPAYWASILLVVLVALLFNTPLNSANVIANTTMIQGFIYEPHLIGLYWTLQVEIVFYALCAFLFYFKILKNNHLIFILIVLFFGIFVSLQCIQYYSGSPLPMSKETQLLPYILSVMFLGYLYRKIYDCYSQEIKPDKILYRYALLGTLFCLGLPLFLLIANVLGYDLIADSFRFGAGHSLGFLLFFSGLLFLKKIPKLLLFLGTISYSLYLFHPIVMKITSQLAMKFDFILGYHVSVYMILITLVSALLAYVIYRFIEKPAVNFSYKLTRNN